MKRVGLTACALLLLFAGALAVGEIIVSDMEEILELLDRGEWEADSGNLPEAFDAVVEAVGLWEQRHTFLHIFLHQATLREITADFAEVIETLSVGNVEGFKVKNARLEEELDCIRHGQRISWSNVF